jgi:hypothetical protein
MHSAWEIWSRYWPDFVVALVLAVIVDSLRIGSLIRTGVRRIQDRLAEQSTASLRTRIQNQEGYRTTLASYLTSDKGLYLHTLGMVLVVLLLMCVGTVILLLERMVPERGVDLLALGIFAIAIVFCVHGIRLASLDTRPKVEELLAKLDAEIAAMKAKLDGKTK